MRLSQTRLEHLLHRQHVLNAIKEEIEEHVPEVIDEGVEILKKWLDTSTWESKTLRQDAIRYHDLRTIVMKVISNVTLSCQTALPLVSISSMTSMSDDLDKLDNIQLAAEVITILAETGTYALEKSLGGTYLVLSQLEPSEALRRQIRIGCYLPPMIQKPKKLECNTDSAYLTISKDSVILGGQLNQHNENISLDVLNTLNAQEYMLDPVSITARKKFHREFLDATELSKLTLIDQQQYQDEFSNYEQYCEQFDFLSKELVDRIIHFSHKPDKRGRAYSQGYHFNPQGSSYEKSCINFAKKELITGDL